MYDDHFVKMDVEQRRDSALASTTAPSAYSSEWERKDEAHYASYTYTDSGVESIESVCWLYVKDDAMFCRLCQKYQMYRAKNGKANLWATTGVNVLAFQRVKLHQNDRIHNEAQMKELMMTQKTANRIQPAPPEMKNALIASIYLCQEDLPFDRFDSICKLMEKMGVQVRPSDASKGYDRPNEMAICLQEIVSKQLRMELIEKVNASPVLAWLLHQAQCKSGEKICIVYVRYLDDGEVKTSLYTIFRLQNENSINFFGECLIELWKSDDLVPSNSSCLFLEKFSINHDLLSNIRASLRDYLKNYSLQFFLKIMHPFSLFGDPLTSMLSMKHFDSIITKIYEFVRPIKNETCRLKNWQYFLDLPEIQCQTREEIRWSNIYGSIKPILNNIRPGSQGLLKLLRDFIRDEKQEEKLRDQIGDLFTEILDDEFLIPLFVLHDVHELILGPLMKLTQDPHLTSATMMKTLAEKQDLLEQWLANPTSIITPSLTNYFQLTKDNLFGSFEVVTCDRDKTLKFIQEYLEELLNQIETYLNLETLEDSFILLFDPEHLVDNQSHLLDPKYGRDDIEILRIHYKDFPNFDAELVLKEWIHFKPLIKHFLENYSINLIPGVFWNEFLNVENFQQHFPNIFLLLNIYLVTLRNNVECAAGFSAASRIPTTGELPLMLDLFIVRMNIRMLFQFDYDTSECDRLVDRILRQWNQKEFDQRLVKVRNFLDRTTESLKRKTSLRLTYVGKIKCANGCNRFISTKSTKENGVTVCSHNNLLYESFDPKYNCSRRLCRTCRTEMKLKNDENWFCNDHVDLSNED